MKDNDTQPYLVIVVCSKPEHTELRLAMRRTWGLELPDDPWVVLRFFVGRDDGWDDIMERERALHGDVVRTDHLDTYENLSHKVLAALAWALHHDDDDDAAFHHHHHPPPLFVMKIDDDTYVNLPHLLQELQHRHKSVTGGGGGGGGGGEDAADAAAAAAAAAARSKYVMGAVCLDSPVVRDGGDRWFVSRLDYPSDVYPPYVFGGGYVMTRAAAEAVVEASVEAEYLAVEDVFVTGVLARAAGVARVSHPGFAFWTARRPSPCQLLSGRRLTAVNLTAKEFYGLSSGIHALLRAGNWTRC